MNRAEISIYAADGNHLRTVPVTKECEREEELMNTDSVTLQWNDTDPTEIPAGAVTHVDGEEFILLDPYRPEQKDEATYTFKPVFQSRIMAWGKVPLMFYTYNTAGEIVSREPDWNLTDTAQNFIDYIARVITGETGEKWTAVAAADLQGVQTVQFSSTDVLSALNMVASAFETEWRADKLSNTLYLGKAMFEGDSVPVLTVGENVGVPSVTSNTGGYYNRFLVFGSTRNITQDYEGANVNNIINKRLTLDPGKYPLGYIDRRENHEPVFSKILVFDEVYPKSNLVVLEARPRLMYVTDEQTGGFKQIGTDKDGKPIYDQYSIWYVQLGTVDDNGNVTPFRLANTDTYGKDNPDGVLIQGKTLSIHFSSGALTGREFELTYHPKAETASNSDGTPFAVKEGDFEIIYTKDDTFIVPSMTGVVPADGNKATLFNLRMPDEYMQGAYIELEQAAMDAIAVYESDRDNYEVESNPVAFHGNEELLGLRVGQHVRLINGDRTLDTRIISLTRKIDYPFEQTIKVGNDMIKGTTQTLKEDVANANKDINLILAFNNLTQNTINSYNRAINTMLDGFARIGRMWQFDENGNIYTEFNAYSLKNLATLGMTGEPGEGGGGGLDEEELAEYLRQKGYATQEWVNSRGFLTSHQSLADYLTRPEAAGLYQPKGNYVAYGRQTLVTANGTNLMPQFINIENENLIAGYKNYWNVINLGSYSGGNFRSQIAMPYQEDITDSDIFIRTANGTRWRAWRRLLHDGNYASVLDSAYLRLSGGTMANTGLVGNLNADLLDGYHEDAFLRWRATAPWTDGEARQENTLWAQIGIKTYNNAVPDGINGAYGYGEAVTLSADSGRFEFYCSHHSSEETSVGGLYFRSGWNDDKRPWVRLATIGSNVASATRLKDTFRIWGQNFYGNDVDGTLYLRGNAGNYREGIRIKPFNNWTAILLGGSDLSADSGTSANSWGIFNNNGNFWINRNGSLDPTGYELCNVNGNWGIGTTAPTAKLHVNGTGLFTGQLNIGELMPLSDGAYNIGSAASQFRWVYANGIYARSGSWLGLGANNTDHVRILANGFVGFGTLSPNARVDINGETLMRGILGFRESGAYMDNITNADRLDIAWRLNGVWQTTPFMFNKSGDFTATGNIVASGNIACLGAVTEASELEEIYQRLARLENEVF